MRKAFDRLTSITASQSSSECWAAGCRRMMPALLTRMSIWPKAAIVFAHQLVGGAAIREVGGEQLGAPPLSLQMRSAVCGARAARCCAAPPRRPPRPAPPPSRRRGRARRRSPAPLSRRARTRRGSSSGTACRLRQKVFARRREDVDQHHFLVEHRRAVLDVRRETAARRRPSRCGAALRRRNRRGRARPA